MLSSQHDEETPYPKGLASWISLDYFRRLRPLRGSRSWVTMAAMLVSALYAGWTLGPARHAAHEAAPVATAHALFNDDCARCHSEPLQPLVRLVRGDLVRTVSNRTCLSCHDGAAHHKNEERPGACAVCHAEHRGKALLARVADGHCTSCHAQLRDDHPKTMYENVSAFSADHPEFRILRTKQKDEAKLHFNHAVHLALDLAALRSRDGAGIQRYGDRLECSACHQPDAERRYLQPISYARHCASCHPLTVRITGDMPDADARAAAEEFRRTPVPHQEPSIVRAVLRERLVEFVQRHPVASGARAEPPRALPGRAPRPVTQAESRWVKGQADEAERLLFTNRELPRAERGLFEGSCRQCHVPALLGGSNGLPQYLPTALPARWLTHGRFAHDSHRMLDCLACHGAAAASQATSDVLLPGLQSCQECHRQPGGARSDCAECHSYHDRSLEGSRHGGFSIDRLRSAR